MIPPYNEVAQYLFNESQEKSRIIEEVQEARNRAQTEVDLVQIIDRHYSTIKWPNKHKVSTPIS